MAELNLDFLVLPTYTKYSLGIADNSIYPNDPPTVISPTLEITVPGGHNSVSIVFNIQDFNVLNSTMLGITSQGKEEALPDGIYTIRYSVTPSYINFIEKSFMRVNQLLEKYDEAFLTLEMMQCDLSIKRQQKVTLSTINFFIQGAISAANNCAINDAVTLYKKASTMLDQFINNGKCCGNNFIVNYV